MSNPTPDKLKEKLEEADPNRVEFPKHVYDSARKRNIDINKVKDKVTKFDFSNVRPNNQNDPNFDFSFKVTLEAENDRYEVPIYFNMPANKLLVKSVWPK